MERTWRESSFQCVVSARFLSLFNHICYFFCIPVTPCGTYLDCRLSNLKICIFNYRGQKQQVRKQRKKIASLSWRTAGAPHYTQGMKCIDFSCIAVPTSSLCCCPSIPLAVTAFPWVQLHHCRADVTWRKDSNFNAWASQVFQCNTEWHFTLQYVCLSYTSDFQGIS